MSAKPSIHLIPSDIRGFSIHLASVEPVLDTTAGRTLNQGIIKLAMQVLHPFTNLFLCIPNEFSFLPALISEKRKNTI